MVSVKVSAGVEVASGQMTCRTWQVSRNRIYPKIPRSTSRLQNRDRKQDDDYIIV